MKLPRSGDQTTWLSGKPGSPHPHPPMQAAVAAKWGKKITVHRSSELLCPTAAPETSGSIS